ncbi:MAG: ABC transporter permease [Pseudomonadota bacterium]|nr:ABC transporter permease [Pseudomonadota bacterium]
MSSRRDQQSLEQTGKGRGLSKGHQLNWARWVTVGVIWIVVVLPLTALFLRSFAFRWLFPDILPGQWGLRAWDYTFGESSRVVEALLNSVGVALLVTMLAMIVGLPTARALGMHDFRGKKVVEWILLTPIIVPVLVAVMGIHIVFIKLRLTGTIWGVALVHLIPATPYFVLVMSSVFANYSPALEETARSLGANKFRVFRYVTFPAISSGLLVASLFTFLISWSQYVTTLLIGSGTFVTLPLVLFPFLGGGNAAVGSAITLIFVAPAILVLILTSRSLGRGSTVMGGFGKI